MNFGTFSGLYTGFLILIFIGIFVWAYSNKRKKEFSEAANLIFDEPSASNQQAQQNTKGAQK